MDMHLDEVISLVWLDMRVEDPQHAATPTDAVRWTRASLRHEDTRIADDVELNRASGAVLAATDDQITEVLADYGDDDCDGADIARRYEEET